MNERRSWNVALIFVLAVAVVVLLIDRAGMDEVIEASEQRARELERKGADLDSAVNVWRTSTEGARDSLKSLKDELRKKRSPRERARDIARDAYGLPIDSLVDGLSREVPDYR